LTSNAYVLGFYDFADFNTALASSYTSASYSPSLVSIPSNNNYTGLNINPTIDNISANGGVTPIAISGTYSAFGTNSYWNGVNINPTITDGRYVAGINVTMDNVTLYPGVAASLVEQDLTFTFNPISSYENAYTLEYTPGATAGSEVVSISGFAIAVQIEDGVSTANQIKTALEAIPNVNAALTIAVSGVGTNAQDIFGPTNFSGGIDAGSKQAAFLDGDVQITGSLSFEGALSVGTLNAFAQLPLVNGTGNPASAHFLISMPFIADNETRTNADVLGVNTAALFQIGANANVTTAFLGLTALGLPAVVTMGAGSYVDRVTGATFAISLDAGSGGGTINEVELCRALALPNGVTTINNLYGFKMDLPFGNPGTTTWGVYISPNDADNYFAKNVLIGSPTATNTSVGLELNSTDQAILVSRMGNTQEGALTAVNGMIIYNNDTNKFRGYANGSWVDLH
jgi:hypothetical protein